MLFKKFCLFQNKFIGNYVLFFLEQSKILFFIFNAMNIALKGSLDVLGVSLTKLWNRTVGIFFYNLMLVLGAWKLYFLSDSWSR